MRKVCPERQDILKSFRENFLIRRQKAALRRLCLQKIFHLFYAFRHAEAFIESDGLFIEGPYTQLHRFAALFFSLLFAAFKQPPADACPLEGVQDTDIVDVKAVMIHEGRVVPIGNDPCKGVSDDLSLIGFCDQDRMLRVFQPLLEGILAKIAGFGPE